MRAGVRRRALYKHCIYDYAAQLVNGTIADYHTPMAGEMLDIDMAHVQTHTSVSELGAKGVGESGRRHERRQRRAQAVQGVGDHPADDPGGGAAGLWGRCERGPICHPGSWQAHHDGIVSAWSIL
jgi:hypothetical protein